MRRKNSTQITILVTKPSHVAVGVAAGTMAAVGIYRGIKGIFNTHKKTLTIKDVEEAEEELEDDDFEADDDEE